MKRTESLIVEMVIFSGSLKLFKSFITNENKKLQLVVFGLIDFVKQNTNISMGHLMPISKYFVRNFMPSTTWEILMSMHQQ